MELQKTEESCLDLELSQEYEYTFPYSSFVSSTHECFVCGDTIDLSSQVCSRFCKRALEQMDFMDNLEAQIDSPADTLNSDVLVQSQTTKFQSPNMSILTEAKLD
jgi:hypothetical protein